MIDIRSLLFVV